MFTLLPCDPLFGSPPSDQAALQAEGMTGSGFAVLLVESLISSDAFEPAVPAPYAPFTAEPGGSSAGVGFDAGAPRPIDAQAPASVAAAARDQVNGSARFEMRANNTHQCEWLFAHSFSVSPRIAVESG